MIDVGLGCALILDAHIITLLGQPKRLNESITKDHFCMKVVLMRTQGQERQQQQTCASTPTLHSLQEGIEELRKDIRELRGWLEGLFITIIVVGGGLIGVLIAQG